MDSSYSPDLQLLFQKFMHQGTCFDAVLRKSISLGVLIPLLYEGIGVSMQLASTNGLDNNWQILYATDKVSVTVREDRSTAVLFLIDSSTY